MVAGERATSLQLMLGLEEQQESLPLGTKYIFSLFQLAGLRGSPAKSIPALPYAGGQFLLISLSDRPWLAEREGLQPLRLAQGGKGQNL